MQILSQTSPPLDKLSQRILCLQFNKTPDFLNIAKIAESFLPFSPRIVWRETDEIAWLFMDIAGTARFFKKSKDRSTNANVEVNLLESALSLAQKMGLSALAAISDTSSGAQVFANFRSGSICPPWQEKEQLQNLPLSYLSQLEGLNPWPKPSTLNAMLDFFKEVGLGTLGQLTRFPIESLRERWELSGELLWKRLRSLERLPISPLTPREELVEYQHLDFPISLVSLLLHAVERPLQRLFWRLEGRKLFCEKVRLELRCEYSEKVHFLEISPAKPNRNYSLFLQLLEKRLSEIDLENPIRDLEISLLTRPEQDQQFDLFDPRETEEDRLQNLLSLLKQSSVEVGFLQAEPSLIPEESWSLQEQLHVKSADPQRPSLALTSLTDSPFFRALPQYSLDLPEAPRPTRILQKPRILSQLQRQQLKLLSEKPTERIESYWWKKKISRDYRFAISNQGECLWVYEDLVQGDWFVHGYFD